MQTLDAGPDGVFAPGSIRDVSDAEGEALISGGFATEVKAEAAPVRTAADLTIEEFLELSAAEQKALLDDLGIEGDAGNAEKRADLYSTYLDEK